MLATLIVSAVATIVAVIIHYECLSFTAARLKHVAVANRRRSIVVILLFVTLAHVIEIWCFGFAYMLLLQFDGVGQFVGMPVNADMLDYIYVSFVCFTTLGFGDIIPQGYLRFMVGSEALIGLVLITWTASFLFMQMERYWRE